MIYPRLNRVRNGQRLSVELVNGLIKRTEYAGDLLRQGKCLAGTDVTVAQGYNGAVINSTISALQRKYFGYIFPSVPSENDILLEEDVPFEFPGGELGGLYARDLPLNERQKVVYPEFVLLDSYKLVFSSAYWANFDDEPTPLGLYQSLSGITTPPYSSFNLGGSNGYPSFGPHPNAGILNSSFFFGGFIMLVKN
jgi:hypothetical protein